MNVVHYIRVLGTVQLILGAFKNKLSSQGGVVMPSIPESQF